MRKLGMLTVLFALLSLAAGCGTAPAVQPGPAVPAGSGTAGSQSTGDAQTGGQKSSATAAPSPQAETATVLVYYTDANLSGLASEKRTITFKDPEEKYAKVMQLLGQPNDPKHEPLWKGFRYHSIRFADGKLTIDAKGGNSYELGGGAEDFAIDALTKTMFQFPEVKSVQIVVDGKPADTLMGHVDISQPFTR